MRVLIIGATDREGKYAYLAANLLVEKGHEIIPFGIREGKVAGESIITDRSKVGGKIDTITLYINPTNQADMLDWIVGLKPRRIIFNPGTENEELVKLANRNGIETELACTLVMLRTGQF